MAFMLGMDFHEGEEEVAKLMRSPPGRDNPTAPMLTPQAARMLQQAPLLALGTLDDQGRPWSTLLGGEAPLASVLGRSIIAIKAPVDSTNDPVMQSLFADLTSESDEDGLAARLSNRMLSALSIDLSTRKRVKLFGHIAGGAFEPSPDSPGQSDVHLTVRIDQSLGNCPKYLNCKDITPRPLTQPSSLESSGPTLSPAAQALIRTSDLFFISSSNSSHDMDTNHRGGAPGFVRLATAPTGATQLIYPEFSGNRLYQTLGNLLRTPRAGLCFPDFATGDVLHLTGHTDVLVGPAAAAILPRSTLAVRVTVDTARFLRTALPFRGAPGEPSPYNPRVRALASERALGVPAGAPRTATLVRREPLTPSIARYGFALDAPGGEAAYRAGQWVALDFSGELDLGYSHMRDDDPGSLNDDFVRTFTVSSAPGASTMGEFEITVRRVGAVTEWLSRVNARGGVEVGVLGFGGEMEVGTDGLEEGEGVGFVAGGVGVTPLLGALGSVEVERLRVFWGVRGEDFGLVEDTLRRHPGVGKGVRLFVTGEVGAESVRKVEEMGVKVESRRLEQADLKTKDIGVVKRWYVCASTGVRDKVLGWLDGEDVRYEDFNF